MFYFIINGENFVTKYMYNNKKIGVGIITCNRPEFLQDCLNGLSLCHKDIDRLVIVNDGKKCDFKTDLRYKLIQHKQNKGVSKSKNDAFLDLLNNNCDYIFIIEDDCTIIHKDCLIQYCKAYEETGLHHLIFAPEGQHLLYQIKYKNYSIGLYKDTIAAFCFYTRECLINCGLMDEFYHNSTEHIDHTYRIIKMGYTFGWMMFPDLIDSENYLDISNHVKYSSCNKNNDYKNNISIDFKYFNNKFKNNKIDIIHDKQYINQKLIDIFNRFQLKK